MALHYYIFYIYLKLVSNQHILMKHTYQFVFVITFLIFSLIYITIPAQDFSNYKYNNTSAWPEVPQTIAFDDSGNAWLPVFNHGIAKFDKNTWELYNAANSALPTDTVLDMKIDKNNVKWIGTGRGLVKIKDNNWTIYDSSNTKYNSSLVINNLQTDDSGHVWLATGSHGLVKFDGNTWTTYDTTNSDIPYNLLMGITIDSTGNKWLIAGSDLQNRINVMYDGNAWTVYDSSNSPLQGFILRTYVDSSDKKWFVTLGYQGLVTYNNEVWDTRNSSNSDLPDDTLGDFALDMEGHQWILTQAGIYQYEAGNWILYDSSNSGLPNEQIYYFEINENTNNIWIVTETGISIYSEADDPTGSRNWKSNNDAFSVYPNPVAHNLYIDTHFSNQIDRVCIRNINGEVVRNHHAIAVSNPLNSIGQASLNVSDLKPAMYFLEIKSNDQFYRMKFKVR